MDTEKIQVKCRGGSTSLVDPSKEKFGLQHGQRIRVRRVKETVTATVLGVGGWPNQFGLEKLWVKEDNGDCSIIESPEDFQVLSQ